MSGLSTGPRAESGADPVDEAADAVVDLTLRGCLQRSATSRERLAQQVYAVVLFAALAGSLGAFFLEQQRHQARGTHHDASG